MTENTKGWIAFAVVVLSMLAVIALTVTSVIVRYQTYDSWACAFQIVECRAVTVKELPR